MYHRSYELRSPRSSLYRTRGFAMDNKKGGGGRKIPPPPRGCVNVCTSTTPTFRERRVATPSAVVGSGTYSRRPKNALASRSVSAGSAVESPPGVGKEDKFASSIAAETCGSRWWQGFCCVGDCGGGGGEEWVEADCFRRSPPSVVVAQPCEAAGTVQRSATRQCNDAVYVYVVGSSAILGLVCR